jgi:hypothetical protein
MLWFGRSGKKNELKDFGSEVRRGRLLRRYQRGLVLAPVEKVVGSVNKSASMNRRFRYKSGKVDARLRRLRQINKWGMCALPPVELYQLGDEYYVVDGHHRMALALENDQPEVDAYVTVYEIEPAEAPAVQSA